MKESKNSSAKSTLILITGTFLSRILGFVRIIAISSVFGSSFETDVLNLVFNVPNNLRKLLAEGALSSAFIPVFASCLHRKDGSDKKLLNDLLSFLTFIISIFLILSTIFSKEIVNFLFALPNEKEKLLAEKLFRIIIFYILFVSISSVYIGVLNTRAHFLASSLAPLSFSICVIGSIFFASAKFGIYSMAIGVILGGVSQALLCFISSLKLGYTPKITNPISSNPDFFKVIKLWIPTIVSSLIAVANQALALYFVSSMKEGSITAFTNAIVFYQLPLGIFANSINSVYFTYLSKYETNNEVQKYEDTLKNGVSLLFIFLFPSTLFMSLLSKDIISLVLFRNKFLEQDVLSTANALVFFCMGMFFTSIFNFFAKIYYSKKKANTPLLCSIGIFILDIIFSLLLKDSMGANGIAFANSLGYIFFCVVLFIFEIKNKQFKRIFDFLKNVFKTTLGCIPFLIVYYILRHFGFLELWKRGSNFKDLLMTACLASFFLISFLISEKILVNEVLFSFLRGFYRKKTNN